MPINVQTPSGEKAYTKEIKNRKTVFNLQEKALAINEAKQHATSAKEEKLSAAKRLALSKKADKTELGKLVNKGLFALTLPVCKNKKLTLKDVEEINFGGAIVGVLVYYVPNFNFEHPIVILISRGIALVIKIKSICGEITGLFKKKSTGEHTTEAGGAAKGHGKNEQKPEGDYIDAGRVVDGMITEEMNKQS